MAGLAIAGGPDATEVAGCIGAPIGATTADGDIFCTAAFTSAGLYPALRKVCFA